MAELLSIEGSGILLMLVFLSALLGFDHLFLIMVGVMRVLADVAPGRDPTKPMMEEGSEASAR
jgi:hypothetical protein